ncbi:rhomboid family intramembrane serine protease [Microbacterium sp. CIAB417]|uniref:rhomboid family intramembrane serine protease n=1 Tax=Microbacterium sp. CIAB417 TaxID=2860287 RepID=UPI001FADCD91|nr:rhomboid family intramembrane serine protease [Microbacterium sp. CIAB417]
MTSPEFTSNRDNFCYRHPDRQSFVLCQRCLRTICPECQTPAAVGVICPECLKEQKKNRTPAQKKADRRWNRGSILAPATGRPVVTYAIMAVTAFIWLLTLIPGIGESIQQALLFNAIYLYPDLNGGIFQPWRVLTAALVHSSSIFHIGFNMLSLWIIGRTLEPMLGRWRFLTLYVLGAVGGSVAVACIDPLQSVVGASGAVFGLFGALIIIGRHLGANITGILVIIGLNLVMGFVLPGIAWQAHIGGAIVGLLVALIFTRTKRRDQRLWQILWLVALALAMVALLAFVPPAVMLG